MNSQVTKFQIVAGSALKAMECSCGSPDCEHCGPIHKLMDAVDEYFPTPERDVDKPFLMPVEDVFTITGRGTVVTGRVERGVVKVGDDVEIVGLRMSLARQLLQVWKCSGNSLIRVRLATILVCLLAVLTVMK